jgi:hypothetical protein
MENGDREINSETEFQVELPMELCDENSLRRVPLDGSVASLIKSRDFLARCCVRRSSSLE